MLSSPKQPITILHHGDDERDSDKEVGGTVSTDLTDKGEKDVEKSADKLEGIKTLYTSPVERAMQSAEIIRAEIHCKVDIYNELGAWKIGNFDGMDRKDFETAQKYFVENPKELTFPEMPDFKLKESFGEFKNRVVKCWNEVANKGEKNIALLTHSKNIKILKAIMRYKSWNAEAKKEFCDPENKIPSGNVEVIKPKTKNPTTKLKPYEKN